MEESTLKSAAAIMALDATAAKVVEALERQQIPAILLKGPALTRWLYDRRIERSYGDVDLLCLRTTSAQQHGSCVVSGIES
jgi:hypothetical protein